MSARDILQPIQLDRSAGAGFSWRLRHLRLETTHVAILYLVSIGLAEFITALIDPTLGVICHIFILVNLLIQASLNRAWWERGFFLSMSIAPVIRIVSMGMPLGSFPQEWWYLLSAIPLYATCWVVIRTVPLTRREIGIQLPERRHWPLTVVVAISGIPLGLTEYLILKPDPIVSTFAIGGVAVASTILLVGTGVIEELIFRGILQATTSEIFGPWWAILYVSVLFGELHTGHMSLLDVFFVIGVALYFAAMVRKTRTLIGVSVSHGLTNIFLFVVFPLLHIL
jgi:membrane protease YdiL (CAAX protease family)